MSRLELKKTGQYVLCFLFGASVIAINHTVYEIPHTSYEVTGVLAMIVGTIGMVRHFRGQQGQGGPEVQQRGKAKRIFGCVGCLGVSIGGLVLLAIFLRPAKVEQAGQVHSSISPTAQKLSKAEIMASVKLEWQWHKDGFGNVMIVDFTFHNKSDVAIKDMTVTCTHSAPSGTKIDSNTRTIYERVPAKSRKHIPGFNMGFIHSQARATSCRIVDLVVL